ncbi:hypothetical protein GQ53DRAFT_803429 [Thozetella sp. PMI_491]|nr:hypothetical protein GQ53DRAFT_803429 [Thozetella sp. PMI_491]
MNDRPYISSKDKAEARRKRKTMAQVPGDAPKLPMSEPIVSPHVPDPGRPCGTQCLALTPTEQFAHSPWFWQSDLVSGSIHLRINDLEASALQHVLPEFTFVGTDQIQAEVYHLLSQMQYHMERIGTLLSVEQFRDRPSLQSQMRPPGHI